MFLQWSHNGQRSAHKDMNRSDTSGCLIGFCLVSRDGDEHREQWILSVKKPRHHILCHFPYVTSPSLLPSCTIRALCESVEWGRRETVHPPASIRRLLGGGEKGWQYFRGGCYNVCSDHRGSCGPRDLGRWRCHYCERACSEMAENQVTVAAN